MDLELHPTALELEVVVARQGVGELRRRAAASSRDIVSFFSISRMSISLPSVSLSMGRCRIGIGLCL
jgi:hypothetical protein